VIHFSNLKKITSGKKFLKKSRAQSERILFFSERERNFVTEREISERVQVWYYISINEQDRLIEYFKRKMQVS